MSLLSYQSLAYFGRVHYSIIMLIIFHRLHDNCIEIQTNHFVLVQPQPTGYSLSLPFANSIANIVFLSQHALYINPTWFKCWPTVLNVGPALKQRP